MQRSILFGLLLLCPFLSICQTEANAQGGKSWLNGGAGTHFEETPPLAFPETRASDVMWEKRIWRVIDTREKMNLNFRNDSKPLYEIVKEGILAGEITPYNAIDDQFETPVDGDELIASFDIVDTVTVIDPVDGNPNTQVVVNKLNPNDIKRWRVQEVWYFDSRYSAMRVRIVGIAPLIESKSDDGKTVRYETPMFWVNYTEAREWLAQFPVPMQNNDNELMSWEDHFEMRQFNSYVYQENDILGRRLKDYTAGRDLLLKSDQIDSSIEGFEHDAWEY